MSMKPLTYLDEKDASPDLKHGVPGVQWASHQKKTNQPAQLRRAAMPADDRDSVKLYLGLVLGIALLLRILVVLMGPAADIQFAYTDQTQHQLDLAQSLAIGHAYGLEAQPENTPAAQLETLRMQRGESTTFDSTTLHPEFYQAPGYPAVLAVMNLIGLPLVWLLGLQCLIGAASAVVVYRIGLGVTGRMAPSILAAVIVAIHPALLIAPATLAGSTFVVLLVLLGLLGVAHLEERGWASSFGGGLAVGLAALFSPVLVWLAPLLGAWMIFTERRLRSVAFAVALMLGAALPVGPWMMRNAQLGVGPIVSMQPTMDALFGSLAAQQIPPVPAYHPPLVEQQLAAFKTFAALPANTETDALMLLDRFSRQQLGNESGSRRLRAMRATAPTLALDHSLDEAYARLGIAYQPAGLAAEFLGEPISSDAPQDVATGWVVNAWVGLNAAMVVGMTVGAGLMLWRRHWAGLLLLLSVLGLWVFMGTAGASETLRLPLIGVQALLITATLAPGPLRVKKAKTQKIRKLKKCSEFDQARGPGSPLASESSRHPGANSQPSWGGAGGGGGGGMGSGEISLIDAIHPALAHAPSPPRPPSGEEAKEFARQVENDRLTKLATSGRPI